MWSPGRRHFVAEPRSLAAALDPPCRQERLRAGRLRNQTVRTFQGFWIKFNSEEAGLL